MAFKSELVIRVGWEWDDGANDNSKLVYEKQLLEGDEDNQANAVWHLEDVEEASGESTVYDLEALERTVLGETVTHQFFLVKAIVIVVTSTTGDTDVLLVGGSGVDEWSEPFAADGDKVKVTADSPLVLVNRVDGWPVDSSNKDLKIAASGGDVTYSIAILGTITLGGSGA